MGGTHTLENNYIAEGPPQKWESCAPCHSPQPWSLAVAGGAPRASGFERQQGLRAEASQDWGAQTPFLEGTHGLMCPGTWGKTVTLQELWPDLPAGLGRSPREVGVNSGLLWRQRHRQRRYWRIFIWRELSGRQPLQHQDLASLSRLRAPVLGHHKPNKQPHPSADRLPEPTAAAKYTQP